MVAGSLHHQVGTYGHSVHVPMPQQISVDDEFSKTPCILSAGFHSAGVSEDRVLPFTMLIATLHCLSPKAQIFNAI